MDLATLKQTVDAYPDNITPIMGDLEALHAHVGLPVDVTGFRLQDVSAELYQKIAASLAANKTDNWRQLRHMREELIQRHVIDGDAIDPYFSVIDTMLDAVRSQSPTVQGNDDWSAAIQYARDHNRINDWRAGVDKERTNTRAYELAKAAKRLQDKGYTLARNGHYIFLEPTSEAALVSRLEQLVQEMSGLNVARRIFKYLTPRYDGEQERYHVVKHVSMTGGGSPEVPFAYLLQLAAKHFLGTKPQKNTDANWNELCLLALDYAAIHDVQEYTPPVYRSMDAVDLLPYLQELALADTLFRIPQVRGTDVVKIARGILRPYDFNAAHGGGWSLNDAFTVISAILKMSFSVRGPDWFDAGKLEAELAPMPRATITAILDELLSHPTTGANQLFSKPKDEPKDPKTGQTFGGYPLLSADRKTYWLLDRSMCAAAFLEAVTMLLRRTDKDFDGKLGIPIENFLRDEFSAHGIPTHTGKYVVDKEDGECDIVVETEKALIFLEIKKKPLTRRAQAGSDAHVLLDLANSLLAAQVQTGWHEVRIKKHGFLDLEHNGTTTRLDLNGRSVERIAVSLMQFGSFQDRILLKQFLEGTMNASFAANDNTLKKKFAEFNALLAELRDQISLLHPGVAEINQPFFHCWFLSVPQILILLDGANGAEDFKTALWKTRHVVTGSSDFYFDNAYWKKAALTKKVP